MRNGTPGQGRICRWLRPLKLAFSGAMICVISGFVARSETAPPTLYEVKLEHVWIPMKDGVLLAAWLYKPVNAPPKEKFPAILKLAIRTDGAGQAPEHRRQLPETLKPPAGHCRRFRRFNVSSVASPWRPRGNQGIGWLP